MSEATNGARRLARAVDRLSRLLSDIAIAIAGLATLVSLVLVIYGVVLRYALNRPQSWLDELMGYLLVAIVMLGAADALRQREHIAIDLLTSRLNEAKRFWVAVLGMIAVAATAALFIAEGWGAVAFSKMVGLRSTGYLDTPLWTVQLLVPVGGFLLLLNAATLLARLLVKDLPVDEIAPASDPTQLIDGRERGS
ncbi:MAG: Tripartite ATP-independent periplasmic transporter DctQ component [Alphaproteobacteria bacterium]|nr:Tripartite ATP-independent periplasmic transporter DctQ component [Alphaproteobacteria bacterium]